MSFVFKMAWREIRSSWRRLLFFFICIAIGVGSIVSLRSIVQNMKASIASESRSLLTADVQVSTNAPWNKETLAVLEKYYSSPIVEAHTQVIETATMLRSGEDAESRPKMVELKAVESPFPFYGQMILAGGKKYSHDLLKGRGVLVKESVLTMLDLKVGDQVKIGKLDFTIRGVVEKEPGSGMSAFSLGPRVIIDHEDAVAAGLTTFGSRVRYRTLFKTREGAMDALLLELERELKPQRLVSVRSFRYSQDRMSESLTRVEDYLSLIGLVILVLGGIGISSVTRVFVQQKMKTIAILKCIGGRNAAVLGTYLLQVLFLGLIGSLMGLGLAQLASILLPRYFAGRLPFDVQFGLTWQATLQGLGIGMLIALLFSLIPLLEIRQIKPILVLRSATDQRRFRFDWVRIAAGAAVIAGLLGLASWQAGSLKVGAIFLGGLAAMTIVLMVAATALMKFLRGLRYIPSFALRQGVNSLYRPGNQTRIILLAVGLGVFFVVSVRSLQLNLRNEFSLDLDAVQADLYLIDIQKDQRQGVEEAITSYTGRKPQIIPTIRTRISRVNQQEVNRETLRNSENRGLLGREYVVTYRPYVEDFETILEGKFWDRTPSSTPEVSIEELLHDELGLNVGDTMTFDIQGRQIAAKVTSVRRVNWRNARTGFLVVFRPGTIEDAPTMFISAIRGPAPGPKRSQLQRELVDKYPNVSVIDVLDIIEVARGIVGNVSLAVTFVGGFVFLSGLLILIGSIAMTKFHRLYESAILKTLGARKKLIVYTLLIEYGVLGLLAGLLGSAAAIALTWAISDQVFKINWQLTPSVNLLGIAVALALVTAVGVLSSWDVMIKKPLGILRSE
ncbi:MAG: ABC transporter permease [Acidobacteriota bacterium]|nr:MAG: ABC transporter permease [Acidobacteriota bacterium]